VWEATPPFPSRSWVKKDPFRSPIDAVPFLANKEQKGMKSISLSGKYTMQWKRERDKSIE